LSKPFRLGFLTHTEGAGDPRRVYQEALELFTVADELGFDVGWVAQHHFKEVVGRLPSLFPFLAAAAQCTRRIRLGTAVVVIPFDNPLRVAEDAAFVDTLSGGRLEFGIGSGFDPLEFRAFGIDPAQRLELTTQGLQTIQRAFRGEPLGEGELRLQPNTPDLADRMWQSGQSLVGAQHVARGGLGMLLSRSILGPAVDEATDALQLPVVNAYREAWQNPHGKPRIGMSRGIYPAGDKRTALGALREDILRTVKASGASGRFPPGESLERVCERLHIFYGHPDEVAEGLRADLVFPYATDLILQYSPVMPPLDEAIRILEQIAMQIAPALGWQPEPAQPELVQPQSAQPQLHEEKP
jgi:alkanesulfonate monooxygenase SsuD/methylene tetrahydromethanopterin reductase-like flavin-dependent oxidoreductase (luciferase family)